MVSLYYKIEVPSLLIILLGNGHHVDDVHVGAPPLSKDDG
jgi:hypothetical protein